MAIAQIILDFDHTLFDADDFKVALATSVKELGVGEDVFWRTYRAARDLKDGQMSYAFDRHVERLAQEVPGLDVTAARACLQGVMDRAEEFLFPDTKDFLSRLISLNIDTVLLTRGDPAFQQEKIDKTGVRRFVHRTESVSGSKADVMRTFLPPEEKGVVFFINDHVEETTEIKKLFPHIIAMIKRRADVPPEKYLHVGALNFRTLAEMKDYLTIYHATHPQYAEGS